MSGILKSLFPLSHCFLISPFLQRVRGTGAGGATPPQCPCCCPHVLGGSDSVGGVAPGHADPFLCVVSGNQVGGLLLSLSREGAVSAGCATWQGPDWGLGWTGQSLL